MDSNASVESGSFVVHSEGSGSVLVHNLHDDGGLSAPFAGVGNGGGRGGARGVGDNGRGNSSGFSAMAAGRCGRGGGSDLYHPSPGGAADGGGAAAGVSGMEERVRRLPRPKPVLRWSQVPQDARPSPAPYLLNRYGSGGAVPAAGAGGAGAGGGGGGPAGGLGDSLDAFKLYVADDGEMKMGNHHNDFYSFSYEAAEDAEDLVDLQQRQLSTSAGGGDFYQDTEDSSYGSLHDAFGDATSYVPPGEPTAYERNEAAGAGSDRRSWAMEPAVLSHNMSRRRRLPQKRRGGGVNMGTGSGSGDAAASKKKGGHRAQRRQRGKLAGVVPRGELGGEGGGGSGVRQSTPSNRSPSFSTSAVRRNEKGRSKPAAHSRSIASVRPGAHVVAGAAAYPNLPASLGALVLLSPGAPTTTPLDKLARLRRHLLQRQLEEERENERRLRKRHSQEARQQAEEEQQLQQQQLSTTANKATPSMPGSPHHTSGGLNSHHDGVSPRLQQPVTELKFSFEDLNRSMGPATARMGAGASLAILRSARQRARESPRLQEVSLKGEAVYVRADPADAAAPSRTDAGTQRGGKPPSAGSAELMPSVADLLNTRQPRELRDPYTGVVIASTAPSAEEQRVPAVSVSRAVGVPFFHDPTAPRPIAVADVQASSPPPPAHLTASEATSSREASLQTSFCAPLSPQTPTSVYVLPSSLQPQATGSAALRPSPQPRYNSAQTPGSSSLGNQRQSSLVPSVHFPPPPLSVVSIHAADVSAAASDEALPNSSGADVGREADAMRGSGSPFTDVIAKHQRTVTESYRDVRSARPHLQGHHREGPFLTCAVPHQEVDTQEQQQQQDLRMPLSLAAVGGDDLKERTPLTVGEYRMPSAISGGGSGQRQRWRLHSSTPAAGFDGVGLAWNGSSSSGAPPPWRWRHGPLPPHTPFSATSSVSGGSRGGQRKTSGSDVGGTSKDNPFAMPQNPSAGSSASAFAAPAASGSATSSAQPVVLNLQGFASACEANWAALRHAAPSPRARAPTSPLAAAAAAPLQLPLYPSLVAPYAAPRNPLEQNIRYNAWTADGVSASSGAACIVHVFTVTRAMLRSVYEYVAYTCVQQREREVREREWARQQRLRDALAAGVLTRDLQRCLRCPHCGTVGQITKAASSRTAAQTPGQRSLTLSQTPRQMPPSVNPVRGLSNSQHGSPALRISASVSNFSLEAQKPHPSLAERGRRALSSSELQSLSRLNGSRRPHTPATPPVAGGSSMHSFVVRNTDASVNDAVVMEPPLQQQQTFDGSHDTHGATSSTMKAEGRASPIVHDLRPATSSGAVGSAVQSRVLPEAEGGNHTTPTSPPVLSGPPASSSTLPPLPPTYTSPYVRLLSPTQRTATAGDGSAGLSVGFPLPSSQTQPSPRQPESTNTLAASAVANARIVPHGASTSPSAVASTPDNKRRPSPTVTATTTTTTVESVDRHGENQLEKSCGSRELSQSFVGPQPQRASNSQPEFQRYATSSFNYSGGGGGRSGALQSVLFSSESQHTSLHPGILRTSAEREESSVRVESRASDGAPAFSARSQSNSLGVHGEEEEEVVVGIDRSAAPGHSAYGPVRKSAMEPPPPPSCTSLPEGYMTPPAASLSQQGSSSPNPIEFTAGSLTPTAHVRRVLSPPSTSSLPATASTLPPLAIHGAGQSSTPPKPPTAGQVARPWLQAGSVTAAVPAAAGSRVSGNASFLGSAPAAGATPTVAPLAPSDTSLFGAPGATGNMSNVFSSSTGQPRDPLAESADGAANRSSFALARHYMCQNCHRDVVPKTSMVSLAHLDERLASKTGSAAATPTLAHSDKVEDNTHVSGEPLGVLTFEDLLQDDALIDALQTYLQDVIMLPATRPPRPSKAVLTQAVPEAVGAAAAATPSAVPNNPRPVPSYSLFSETEVPHRTDVKSPTLPSVAPSTPSATAAAAPAVGSGARSSVLSPVDAFRASPSDALRLSGEAGAHASGDRAPTTPQDAYPHSLSHKDSSVCMKPQVPMPIFTRLLSKSLASSSSPSSSASSSPRLTAGEEKKRHASLAGGVASTEKSVAPLLLRLCVPCCGLKVSVLEFVKPRVRALAPLQLPECEEAAETTPVAAGGRAGRRKSLGSGTDTGGRRLSKRFSCPPPTIPRMREDAATRGLTQSALSVRKDSPTSKRGDRAAVADIQRGRAERTAADRFSRRLQSRRDGKLKEHPMAASLSGAPPNLGIAPKTVMQDTDASKRHRVQVNARVHLDATSIDRIWERVFTQDKSSAVAAVAAGRDASRAKRLKAITQAAAHTPSAAGVKPNSESPRKTAAELPAALLASKAVAPSRAHQQLGINLDAYDDASVVLKVELAYPRLPGGNVRQLLDEWVSMCQPHPVLLEAAIRNIVHGVLSQLQTLHAAGFTSGNVKSTNVFPLWHLVKATSEAGMKMPPRAAARAASAHNTDAASGVHKGRSGTEGRSQRSSLSDRPRSERHNLEASARASTKSRDGLLAAEAAVHGVEMTTTEENTARPASEQDDRSHPFRTSLLHSPTLNALSQLAKEASSQSLTTAPSVASMSMPGIHITATLATPIKCEGVAQGQPSPQSQRGPLYRRMSTKAPLATVEANGNCSDSDGGDEAATDIPFRRESSSQSVSEMQRRPSSTQASTLRLASNPRPRLSPPQHARVGEGGGPLTTDVLSVSDMLLSHPGNSGSGAFPFSPATGLHSQNAGRLGRRFSIDDSVISTSFKRRNGEGGRRRTRSAEPTNAHCHRSDSVHNTTWDEEAELIPLIVEAVAPSGTMLLAAAGAGAGANGGALPASEGVAETSFSRDSGHTSTKLCRLETDMGRGPLNRQDRNKSPDNSSKLTTDYSRAGPEEKLGLRYVRGAQLIPPARVLLPSLRSFADRVDSKAPDSQHQRGSQSALLLLSPYKKGFEDSFADEGEDSLPGEACSLLTNAPTGAVPRPKSLSYSHDGGSSTKAIAAGRGSDVGTDPDGSRASDALDPLQWSQQVMLVENLGTRVETALRLAMTTVLTQHPPCSSQAATMPARSKSGGKASVQDEHASASAVSGFEEPKKSNGDCRKSLRGKAVAAAGPRTGPSTAGSIADDGAAEKVLNVYVPKVNATAAPQPPLLFGIQESEYVPAPETIRSARDEAKALWHLWRQQQQYSSSAGRARDHCAGDSALDDSENAQMEYVAEQLADQACPATTLRNTLDPYAHPIAAVDVWQLGMMALDLADGPAPTTWLKQREPTPRLSPYPWSSYFQSFVSSCLQVDPKRRATVDDLLRHPWFSVALVPQVTGGGGDRSLRDGRLLHTALQTITAAPRPRLSCVMGVDCLTAEEKAEWEAFDYTLLYANAEGMHPLRAASPTLPSVNAAASISGRPNATGRLRRTSANSVSVTAPSPRFERAGAGGRVGGSTTGLANMSTGGDSAGVSLTMGISGGNNVSGVSLSRFGASVTNANANVNNSSINAAAPSVVDAEFSAMSSVDLAQYFTRLAMLQWRRQQNQQQYASKSLGGSLAAAGGYRGSVAPSGFAPDTTESAVGGACGMGNALLNASFEHSLHISTEEVLTLLRQSPSNTRYLQLGSPRQSLYNVISPRPPQPPTTPNLSQGQQTDGALLSPLQPWRNPPAASVNGAAYSLPTALNGRAAGGSATSLLPPAPSTSSGGGPMTFFPPPPPPLPLSQKIGTKLRLPSAYVHLRDPRGGGGAHSLAPVAHTAAAFTGSSAYVSPRLVHVAGEPSLGAAAGPSASQRQNLPPPFQASARDGRSRFGATALDDREAYSDKVDPHWGDFSDREPHTGREAVGDGSESTSCSDSSDGDTGYSFDKQSSWSSSSEGQACGKTGYSSSAAHSSSHSRSCVSSFDDAHLANRGGGEVPFRRSSAAALRDDSESRGVPAPRRTRDRERDTREAVGPAGEYAPPGLTSFAPFEATPAHAGGAGDGSGAPPMGRFSRKQLHGPSHGDMDGAGNERRQARRPTQPLLRHLLLGTVATSLARLSAVVASTSDSDDDSSENSSVHSIKNSDAGGSAGSNSGSADDREGRCEERRSTSPDSGRTRTQYFSDAVFESGTPQRGSDPVTADAEGRVTRRGSYVGATSAFTPLSSLNPYAHHRSETAEEEFDDDANYKRSSGSDIGGSDDDAEDDVEEQCDEILRCFSALQRGSSMAVSLWCMRMFQQATLHPRTAATAARLLKHAEMGVAGGTEAKNLAWLSASAPLSKALCTAAHIQDEEAGDETPTRSTAAATETPPPVTPEPTLDTCPSSFHNYELARWLYAAHQTIPRCV